MLQKQEFEQTNLNRIEGELMRSREELSEVQTSLEGCLQEIRTGNRVSGRLKKQSVNRIPHSPMQRSH